MTHLLDPMSRTPRQAPDEVPRETPTRGTFLSALLGGLGAAAAVLVLTTVTALGGWFAADAGRYGDTTDAVRVGADAWLLAVGAGLHLDGASVTVLPLTLTVLVAYAAYRSARWVAVRTGATDLRAALGAVSVMAPVHATLALLVAVLAGHPDAEARLLPAFLGAGGLMLLAGGVGACTEVGATRSLLGRLPGWAVAAVRGAAAVVLTMLAAGSVLVGAALLVDFGAAATVLSRLHLDGASGLLYTLVGIAFVPNAVLLACGYLLGPGFMVGTATVVSPSAVVLGPVPAFPLLAALPGDGATPVWAPWLVALPVATAAVAVVLTGRGRYAAERYDGGAGRGLAAGLLAGLVLTALMVLAGGSAGPGRMADVGVSGLEVLLAATVALGGGGLLGGAGATFVHRRSVRRGSTPGTGDH